MSQKIYTSSFTGVFDGKVNTKTTKFNFPLDENFAVITANKGINIIKLLEILDLDVKHFTSNISFESEEEFLYDVWNNFSTYFTNATNKVESVLENIPIVESELNCNKVENFGRLNPASPEFIPGMSKSPVNKPKNLVLEIDSFIPSDNLKEKTYISIPVDSSYQQDKNFGISTLCSSHFKNKSSEINSFPVQNNTTEVNSFIVKECDPLLQKNPPYFQNKHYIKSPTASSCTQFVTPLIIPDKQDIFNISISPKDVQNTHDNFSPPNNHSILPASNNRSNLSPQNNQNSNTLIPSQQIQNNQNSNTLLPSQPIQNKYISNTLLPSQPIQNNQNSNSLLPSQPIQNNYLSNSLLPSHPIQNNHCNLPPQNNQPSLPLPNNYARLPPQNANSNNSFPLQPIQNNTSNFYSKPIQSNSHTYDFSQNTHNHIVSPRHSHTFSSPQNNSRIVSPRNSHTFTPSQNNNRIASPRHSHNFTSTQNGTNIPYQDNFLDISDQNNSYEILKPISPQNNSYFPTNSILQPPNKYQKTSPLNREHRNFSNEFQRSDSFTLNNKTQNNFYVPPQRKSPTMYKKCEPHKSSRIISSMNYDIQKFKPNPEIYNLTQILENKTNNEDIFY